MCAVRCTCTHACARAHARTHTHCWQAIEASGGGWQAGPSRRAWGGAAGTTVGELRSASRRGGVPSTNPYRRPPTGPAVAPRRHHGSPRGGAAPVHGGGGGASPIPASFDARSAWPRCSSIATARDQGRCGSCWAFSSAEALADRWCVATEQARPSNVTNVTLSVEYLMDCDTNDNGCGGGLLDDSWRFMAERGLPTENCIPYQEEMGPEPRPIPCFAVQRCLPGAAGAAGSSAVPGPFVLYRAAGGAYPAGDYTGDVQGMQREILARGPISVAFQVFSDFHNYRDGVYHRTAAGLGPDGGHAVKIIGWGQQAGATDTGATEAYWIVANSWGPQWGMGGFFHIRRGTNECGIEQTPAAGRIIP